MIWVTMNGRRRRQARHHIARYVERQRGRVIEHAWWMSFESLWLDRLSDFPQRMSILISCSGPSMIVVKR